VGAAAAAAVAVIGATAVLLPAWGRASASFPDHVFAPYVDIGFTSVNGAISGSTLSNIANDYGDDYFTLAFVDGSGCQWSMYNSSTYQTEVNNLRSIGGDAIISFGGYNSDTNGTDLGATCSSASAMATQVEDVVNYFNADAIDFDIESSEQTNTTDLNTTSQALAQVRSWASSSGISLTISYTIPTLPTGLTSTGEGVLTNARSNGFTPDVVNIMTMDYGTSGTEMGTAANQALDAVAGQLEAIYGISSSQAYGMLGNTPMIGQNDSSGEIFTLSDASTVESYAAKQGIARLSFWSEGRDNGGCPGQTTASSTCSGISQNTGQFTQTFTQFTSDGPSTPPPTSSPTPPPTGPPTATPTPTPSPTGNLVQNPSFATGDLTDWSCSPNDSVVTSPTYNGDSYALAASPTDSDDAQCSQSISVSPGTTYTLSAEVEGSYAFIGVSGTGTSDSDTWTSSSSWTQLGLSFTTGSSTTSMSIYIHGWYDQGPVNADDFSVTAG
jgi:chitinase